jgi:hypothetical protein
MDRAQLQRERSKAVPFSIVGPVAVSPIAPVAAVRLVWLAGALNVRGHFRRDGRYELLAV